MNLVRRMFSRFCVIAAVLACLPAVGALTQLTANRGQVNDLLTVNNTEVYAATEGGGLYKSTDAGASWTRLAALTNLPARPRYIVKLAGRDGQAAGAATVYVASTVGVFKTTNSGTTWAQVYGGAASAVAVNPTDSNHVLIGVRGIGVLRSTSGGAGWALAGGYDSSDVNAITFRSTTEIWVGLEGNNTGNWGGVWRSVDSGASFAVPPPGQLTANKFVRAIAFDSLGNAYAGTFNPNTGLGGIYRSLNGTGAWTLMSTGGGSPPFNQAGIRTLHQDKNVPSRMWAGTGPYGYSMWRLDAGTWAYANFDQPTFSQVGAIATFSGVANRALFGIGGMGIYLTTNSGAALGAPNAVPLTMSTSGFAADRVNALTIPSTGNTTIYMGLTGASVQKSTNSGASFSTLLAGFQDIVRDGNLAGGNVLTPGYEQIFTVKQLAASPTTAGLLYAAVLGRGLYRSTNSGGTWAPVNEPGLDNSPISPVPVNINPRGLLFEADNAVYYSFFEKPDGDGNLFNDNAGFYRFNGASWSRVLAGPWPGNGGAGKITKFNNVWYALINEDRPYYSLNGVNFAQYPDNAIPHLGFARIYFTDLAGNPGNTQFVVASTNKGFFRSSNGGSSYAFVPTVASFSTTNYSAVEYANSGMLFVGTLDGQIFCSSDNGANYLTKTLPAGWASSAVDTIVRHNASNTMYFLTDGNGAWRESPPTCP